MNFFDIKFGVSDLILIGGWLWQYFNHKKQTMENKKEIAILKKQRLDLIREHIKPINNLIEKWQGTGDNKGIIDKILEELEDLKTIINGLSESNFKRSN